MKNILLIGGTGVIGKPLIQLIQESEKYNIYVTTRNKLLVNEKKLTYLLGNSLDKTFISEVISKYNFTIIIDFMVYPTIIFEKLVSKFLANCEHYIFLSSYRVYSNTGEKLITENSLRLIDDIKIDKNYRKSEEYAIKKAKQENILFSHNRKNWTILRPSITYGLNRIQLFCFEAPLILSRIKHNLPLIIPDNLDNITTTLTDSEISAKYIFKIINNPVCFSQVYNISSDFYISWLNLFEFYQREFGLEFQKVNLNKFYTLHLNKYQVNLDRMINRKLSGKKIRDTVDFVINDKDHLKKLKYYIDNSKEFNYQGRINGRMDKLIHRNRINLISKKTNKFRYFIGYNPVSNFVYGLLYRKKYLK